MKLRYVVEHDITTGEVTVTPIEVPEGVSVWDSLIEAGYLAKRVAKGHVCPVCLRPCRYVGKHIAYQAIVRKDEAHLKFYKSKKFEEYMERIGRKLYKY